MVRNDRNLSMTMKKPVFFEGHGGNLGCHGEVGEVKSPCESHVFF